jgi:hypothetical protein
VNRGAAVNREIGLLGDLARVLAKLGLQVGMSDARPAVFLRDDAGRIAVVVSVRGEFFQWCDGDDSHVVTDMVGATGVIAAEYWARIEDPDGTP